MPHTFTLKLERARKHLEAFKKDADTWVKSKPYILVDEPDPEPPPQPIDITIYQPRRFRIVEAYPVPTDLSLIIGDFAGNLRASLDHLALSLAESFTPTITDKQRRLSEFPIYSDQATYAQNATRRIACIDPAACAAIEALQPYQRGNAYAEHPLWLLHEICNIDKHRTLHQCICASVAVDRAGEGRNAVGMVVPQLLNMRGYAYFFGAGASASDLKLNAIMGRYAPQLIDPKYGMDFKPFVTPEITFADGGPAALEPTIPALESLFDFVGNGVIAPLSKFL